MKSYLKCIKDLFHLANPMILGNLGIVLIGAGDVFVAAKYSTSTLASVSIANSIIMIIFLFGIGLLASISPLLSNFRGSRNNIKKYFVPSVIFSQILAGFSFLIILLLISLISKLNFEAALLPDIKKYMFICGLSFFGVYLQVALKEYLQAYEIVVFPNLLNIIGVIVHLYLDFVLVFGWFGLPAMGAVGLALATLISRAFLGLILLLYCLKFLSIRFYKDFGYYLSIIKIGFPIAIAALFESAAYNMITIIVGKISGTYAAAQSILMIITTATFMIPLAISNAVAVKVGFANGAKNFENLKKYAVSGLGVSTIFMSICAFLFIVFPTFFIKIFTSDAKLIAIAAPVMILMGVFQVFDGLQVTLAGIFKGLKKTKVALCGNFIAFWVIGLPLGAVFAYKYNMGLYGFWLGLTVALVILSLGLGGILIRQLKNN